MDLIYLAIGLACASLFVIKTSQNQEKRKVKVPVKKQQKN